MEAAIAWGLSWSEWLAESPVNRAKMMAHIIHRGLREAYITESASEKAKKGEKPKLADFNDYMGAVGAV